MGNIYTRTHSVKNILTFFQRKVLKFCDFCDCKNKIITSLV